MNTVNSFNEQVATFKRIYIPEPSAIDNQKTYLQRIKKNDKLTVPQFLDRLKHINMLLLQFPDANPDNQFSPQEIKKLFYHAMPVRWRTNFINSGQSLQSTTTDLLQTYMVQQEQQTDAHRKRVCEQNKSNQSKGTGSSSHNGRFSSKSNKHSAPNQGAKNNKRKRLNNDDDCPIHGSSHKWGQCHQNQYGDNFRPRRQNISTTSSRTRSSNYSGRGPPSQVQVYTAQAENQQVSQPSDNQDTNTYHSNSYTGGVESTASSYRYENNSQRHRYFNRDTYFNECHNNDSNDQQDFLPEGTILIKQLNGVQVDLFGLCLFDSGSTCTLFNSRALPASVSPKLGEPQKFTTTQGTYSSQEIVTGTEIFFPDFCKTRIIPDHTFRLFTSPTSCYDVIIGRNLLQHGFVLDHGQNLITWDGLTIPMHRVSHAPTASPAMTSFSCAHTANSVYAATTAHILHAKYERVTPDDVIAQSTHLSRTNQRLLHQLLSKFPRLFSGQLGRYVKNNLVLN